METGFDLLTLPRLLQNAARLYPNKAAITDAERDRSVTYKELAERTNRLANALRARGVKKGDKVAFMCHDRLEGAEIMYAVNRLGAVWVPQNFRFNPPELVRQMAHCDAEFFFVDENCIDVCQAALPELTNLRSGGLFSIGCDTVPDGFTDFEALVADGATTEIVDDVVSSDMCGIIYTSGTTGVAKGVMHSYRSFFGWAMIPVMQNVITSEDVFMNSYPMFHMGGTVLCAVTAIAGCQMVLLGSFTPQRWVETISKYKVSVTCAVPTVVHAVTLLPQDVLSEVDLSSLKRLATSGAPFLTETQDAAQRLLPGVKFYSYYSASEIFQSMLLPEDHARKTRCVGKAAYGMEVRILGDDGNELPVGESGEIFARGISAFIGYYKNPKADASAIRDGWVSCGDVGVLDDEGYLYVVDRQKDVINSGGEKIFSPDVEGRLLEMPGVNEVAVIGVRDDYWGERVHAVLSLVPDASISEDDVLKWCNENIKGYKKPRSVEIRDALPKSPVGKILKREIRDEYWKDADVKV